MSVILSFELCEGSTCNTLKFSETTGAYSLTNLNGWGVETETIASATSATLTITAPGSTTASTPIDLFALSPSFPTITTTQEYSIPMTSLGLASTASMTDGVWYFLYTVVANGITFKQTVTQAFYCQVECCVKSMFKDLDYDCDCSKEGLVKADKAWLMLQGLKYSANSGNKDSFNKDLALLQKICKNSDCNNCR